MCGEGMAVKGGSGRGMANIEASTDGKKWFVLLDGMTGKEWGRKNFSFDGELPGEIVRGTHVYIRIRLHTENAPGSVYTVAQFGRSHRRQQDPPPFFELTFLEAEDPDLEKEAKPAKTP